METIKDKKQSLRVDKTKLKTVKNYAEMIGITVQGVHKMIDTGRVELELIDGVRFIRV